MRQKHWKINGDWQLRQAQSIRENPALPTRQRILSAIDHWGLRAYLRERGGRIANSISSDAVIESALTPADAPPNIAPLNQLLNCRELRQPVYPHRRRYASG